MTTRPLQAGDPERLGTYRLIGRLGEGGQGVVFLAEADSGEFAAAKLLRPEMTGDGPARERFVSEAAAAKRVARFCTAQVLDVGTEGDRPYIISEYVDGPTLHRAVVETGPRSGAALERLAIGTATALAAIHEAGVVHRDFKPHNVILGPDGPRVIDFGIARALDASMTGSSGIVGTPAYVAPEQVAGEAVGPPADVFAWASTMVFAANGTPPFAHDSIPAVLHAVLHADPDLGDLSAPLRDLVGRCLAKHPSARPTAQQVLLSLLSSGEVTAPIATERTQLLAEGVTLAAEPAFTRVLPEEATVRTDPPWRRSRVALGLGGLLAIGVLVLLAVVLLQPFGDRDGAGPQPALIPEGLEGDWAMSFLLPSEGTNVTWNTFLKAGSKTAIVESGESGCASGTLTVLSVDDRTLTMRFSADDATCSSANVVATVRSRDAIDMRVSPDGPDRPYEGVLRRQGSSS